MEIGVHEIGYVSRTSRTWEFRGRDADGLDVATVRDRRAATTTPMPIAGRTLAFRPSSRSRVRIAVGALVAISAIAVMLLIFSTADKRIPVLQLVRDVPAGQQLTGADLRTIELSADPTLAVVRASDIGSVVGGYARVRMISGSLLAVPMLQRTPLVAAGSAVVAVTIAAGELPAGLRERSRVQLVFPRTSSQSADALAPEPVAGRVVGLPTAPDSSSGKLSVSVEVGAADAVTVAQAPVVRIVLLDPGVDAASAAATPSVTPAADVAAADAPASQAPPATTVAG
jgi:hypothetical protein